MKKKRELGIVTQVHYIPIPMHPYYSKLGFEMKNLVNAKNYYNNCLSLPIFYDLSDNQQKYVIDFLKTYVE
jgi:dTDP-4-amino-4,6-dideoxygalactose transaminase